jgi:predicted glycosyltransferase
VRSLLVYCQHSVGLGHLMRSYALCGALSARFRVVLLCGGPVPDGIRAPAGVEILELPPLGVDGEGMFSSQDPAYTLEQAWEERTRRILAAFGRVAPAAVLVEQFPFGRARFARELVPLLEAARAAGAATACSVRDILVSHRADQQRFDDRAAALARAHFDVVLVHSDPRFARFEDTFAPSAPLAVPLRYTGFVVRDPEPVAALRREGPVLVSAGGGLVGEPLLSAAIGAARLRAVPMKLVAGPLLPRGAWDRLCEQADGLPELELVRSVPDLGAELADARASVSQGGYNTSLEIVRSRVPALVIPYATEEENEQTRRALRLERLGALRVLDPGRLDPSVLAWELERLSGFTPRPVSIDLDGGRTSARILERLLATPEACTA